MSKIGIIGGSGLDNLDIFEHSEDIKVETKFGKPSSPLKIGKIFGVDVVFLARHGREHTIPPSEVNARANISALKEFGCTHILATTAVGSLREEIHRGDFVILDQFIDFTRHRKTSFYDSFEPNNPKHTPMAEPFSEDLRQIFIRVCEELNIQHHKTGTVVTIEGPRFSTRAESKMFRMLGSDVINMSIAPEAALAREAGIPYAAIAMSTDYDSWKTDEEPVTWEAVLEVFNKNSEKVAILLEKTIAKLANDGAAARLKEKIRVITNWPKQGVMFRDITTLLKDNEGFSELIKILALRYGGKQIDIVAGIESRGFIIGAALASALGVGFVPIRKAGKLPGETIGESYNLEYGSDRLEIHKDALVGRKNVLIVDDLIATGGTALTACNLARACGVNVFECCFAINLRDLGGKKRLETAGYPVFNVLEFGGS